MTIQELLRNAPLKVFDEPPLVDIAKLFSSKTRFDGKTVINEPVLPGMLGIFFARFDPNGPLHLLRNSCIYVPCPEDRHMVVCDVDFLTDWRNALSNAKQGNLLALSKKPKKLSSDNEYMQAFYTMFRAHLHYMFPRWVVGHEIGHAVLRHATSQSLELTDSSTRRRLSMQSELDADKFVVDHMINDDEESQMHFFGAITHLLNEWIADETGVTSMNLGAVDYRGQSVTIRDASPTHPPMILRLLTLIDAFLVRFPTIDTTGFYQRVRAHVVAVAP
jgi:hypothetical protein